MLQIGLFGSGNSASRHAAALETTGVGKVTKVYSPAVDATAFASRCGAMLVRSPDEMLNDSTLNCLAIASPTDTHASYLKQVHAAGVPVVCEAPLMRTNDEASEIEALFRTGVSLVSCGFIRHQPEYRHLQSAISKNSLGTLGTIRLNRCIPLPASSDDWRTDFGKSGGVILDLLVHDLDVLEWCFGKVSRIQAMRSTVSEKNLRQDYALITAKMESGAIAHLEGSWMEAPNTGYCAYEIAGAQGILDYDSRNEPALSATSKSGQPVHSRISPTHAAYCALWRNVANAVAKNEIPESPLSSALQSTRLALAALQSSTIKSPVILSEF